MLSPPPIVKAKRQVSPSEVLAVRVIDPVGEEQGPEGAPDERPSLSNRRPVLPPIWK